MAIHRQSFAEMSKPTAPEPAPIDVTPIRSQLRAQNLAGIKRFARAERKAARAEADRAADALAALQFAERIKERDAYNVYLDEWWAKLLANDPEVTEDLVERAFEDNDAAATVLSVDHDEMAVVVIVPDDSAVPERMPTTTAAGNLSIRKMPKKDRDAYYREVVAGDMLVTVREALAVAPAIASVRIVAVRTWTPNAFGKPTVQAMAAAAFSRRSLESVAWDRAAATTIMHEASTDLAVNYRGAAQTMAPIDLSKEPEVAGLVASIDLDELS